MPRSQPPESKQRQDDDESRSLRYVVTPNAEEHSATIRTALSEVAELNQRGPCSYSRNELVELLDAALLRSARQRRQMPSCSPISTTRADGI